MSTYAVAVLCLLLALMAQCIAAGMAALAVLRPPYERATLAFAIAFSFLALQHAYSLELALHAGIFDLRQSVLSAVGSVLILGGTWGLRRRKPETPPPR